MSAKKRILVTGASGFIGSFAVPVLKTDFEVDTLSMRSAVAEQADLSSIDAIIYLSGIAHQTQEIPFSEYDKVNHQQPMHLAAVAKSAKVRQFIYLSSTKVYGDHDKNHYDELSECLPTDSYGLSKLNAEKNLLTLAADDFKVSIIRPPLVYGPGVKGNLEKLIKIINRLPILPFGGIRNERSMVYVGNLTALIKTLLDKRMTGIFIAGEKRPVATTELINTMIKALGLSKSNVSLPGFSRMIIRKFKPAIYQRLFESFVVDNSGTNRKLQFDPPFTFEAGIKAMVSHQK